jgi:hypothetical protein
VKLIIFQKKRTKRCVDLARDNITALLPPNNRLRT